MDVVVGTYEEIVLGYKIKDLANEPRFETSFSDHSHTGCIKAIDLNQRGFLATGSSDENINLFNLRKQTEIGTLIHHKGTVTCLSYFGKSHLLSGSEDGSIGVWQVGRWECLRTLKGPKGAVSGLSIHPSGKLALSVSCDKTLRTWNLITGRSAFITNTKQVAEGVVWSPDGLHYLVRFITSTEVYSAQKSGVQLTLEPGFRAHTVIFITDTVVAFGGEEGKMELYDITDGKLVHSFSTETSRVKALNCSPCADHTPSVWLFSASSDGFIKLWKLQTQDGWSHSLVCEVDTKFRLTCLTTAPLSRTVKEEPREDTNEEEMMIEDGVKEEVEEEEEVTITVKEKRTKVNRKTEKDKQKTAKIKGKTKKIKEKVKGNTKVKVMKGEDAEEKTEVKEERCEEVVEGRGRKRKREEMVRSKPVVTSPKKKKLMKKSKGQKKKSVVK